MTTRTQIIADLRAAKHRHAPFCAAVQFNSPCNCAAEIKNNSIDAAIAELEKLEETNPYYLAIDDACVTAHIGTAESFATPKEALNAIIAWEIAVATDPAVNGGFSLQPVSTPADEQPVGYELNLSQVLFEKWAASRHCWKQGMFGLDTTGDRTYTHFDVDNEYSAFLGGFLASPKGLGPQRPEPDYWISYDVLSKKERIEKLPIQSLQPGIYKHTPLYLHPPRPADPDLLALVDELERLAIREHLHLCFANQGSKDDCNCGLSNHPYEATNTKVRTLTQRLRDAAEKV